MLHNTPAEAASIPVPRDLVVDADRRAAAVAAGLVAAGVALVVGVVAQLALRQTPAAGVVLPAAAFVAAVAGAGAAAWRWFVVVDDACAADRAARARAVFFGAVALLAPLALHGVLQVWRWAPLVEIAVGTTRSFGAWVQASLMYVPHTHVVFAGLWAVRGFLRRGKPSLRFIAAATVGVTLFDIVLWGVYGLLPTGYVAVTLLVLLPGLRWLEGVVDDALGG